MFRKLVSNLPYSPQLIEQVGFYAQRLKQEEFSRRIGVVFALLGMVLQFFVFLAPPEPSLATSTNDIVYGGIANGLSGESPQDTMLRIYNDNFDTRNNDIQKIFNHFGIDANDIRNSTLTEISSKNRALHSLGRENKHAEDKPVRIEDNTYYLRPLYVWDVINDYNVYDALKIPGRDVWILLSCGNIVVEKPTPDLSIQKSSSPSPDKRVKPGDTINYELDVINNGQVGVNGLIAEDVVLLNNKPTSTSALTITDVADSNDHDVVSSGPVPGFYNDIPHAYWLWHDYAAREERTLKARYVVPSQAKDGDVICNTAYIRSSGTQTKKSQSVCHRVEVEPLPNPQLEINKSVPANKYKVGDTFEYTVTVENTGDAILTNITINDPIPDGLKLKDGSKEINEAIPSLGVGQEESLTYSVEVQEEAQSTITNQACAESDSIESTCDETTVTIENDTTPTSVLTPDISLSKGAKVVSAPENDPRRQDAHKTTVISNDVIEYRLLISNTGDGDEEDFIVTEDLSDVLEYAEVIDNGGGTLNEDGLLTWEPRTIAAGETIEHIFRVKVKDPIPSTPNSVSDPQSYDLKMDNIYGSTQVQINVEAPTQKVVENAVKELPRTGIGTNAALTILFTGIVGYFYSRNKQLIEEIRRLRSKYNNGVQYES